MARNIYELSYDADKIDELLGEVDQKSIYSDATTEAHGLMSAADKSKLDNLPTAQQLEISLSGKVDAEEGKGLSTNDYTNEEKQSVASAYHKPQNGIPKTDLDSSVQTSLDKADTALQSFAETDPTVPSWAKQPNKPSYNYSEIGNTPDLSGYITKSVDNLVNYYLKSETYTKDEVQQIVNAIKQFTYQLVDVLPAASADTMNKIYLVPSADPQAQNVKDEYITIDNGQEAQTRYTFEQIGSTAIDLSGYYTSAQTDTAITNALNTALADYTTTTNLNTLLAGKQDTIPDLSTIRSGARAGATAVQPADIANKPDFVEEDSAEDMADAYTEILQDLSQALTDASTATNDATAAASNANAKATLANSAATIANQKAGLADDAATLANQKASYAQDQGDYAKAQGDAVAIVIAGAVSFVEDLSGTWPE